jgi:hypothetical protein
MRGRRAAAILWLWVSGTACAGETDSAVRRVLDDARVGKPLVAHVIVALADNDHQGIVPIPATLGNGDRPQSNLYWGAMYGVKGFLKRSAEWRAVPIPASSDPRILERTLFRRDVVRNGKPVTVYLLAEAWQGRQIADAIGQFLEVTRGQHVETIRVDGRDVVTGGAAHLVAYVGHNGLMDFEVPALRPGVEKNLPRVAVVLACQSDFYFSKVIRPHAAPLVTTASLMAPEAYVLDAVVSNWFAGATRAEVLESAAGAYGQYQKISIRSARRIFHRDP